MGILLKIRQMVCRGRSIKDCRQGLKEGFLKRAQQGVVKKETKGLIWRPQLKTQSFLGKERLNDGHQRLACAKTPSNSLMSIVNGDPYVPYVLYSPLHHRPAFASR